MRHYAAGEIDERNRAGECVIQKEGGFIGLKICRQNAARLQIRHLTGRERNQLANAFVKSGCCPGSQQVRDFRARVSLEVIAVTKLVMRGEKPARVRLDALQRTNVVLEIDMPAGGVRVLFAL